MFGWKVNQVRNYEKIELEVTAPEQLLERNWNLVHVVYLAFARLSIALGKLNCKLKNSERKEKKILKNKLLKVETTVMKKVNVKEMKWQQEWKRFFKIKSYDLKIKSYNLVYLMGILYANKVPISQLKVIKVEVKVDELYKVNISTLVQTKEGMLEICWIDNWRAILRSLMKKWETFWWYYQWCSLFRFTEGQLEGDQGLTWRR